MTENEFVSIFINSGALAQVGLESGVAEVETAEGVPDVLAVQRGRGTPSRCELPARLFGNGHGMVLSLLHTGSPRTVQYVARQSGLEPKRVSRLARELAEHGLVQILDTGRLVLGDRRHIPDFPLVALEFKLRDLRRAIRQAVRYQSFSHYVYVVMPPSSGSSIPANAELVHQLGLGLITFDPKTAEVHVRIRPKRRNPRKRNLYLDAAARYQSALCGPGSHGTRAASRFPRLSPR